MDRTAPALPGISAKQTHDYVRHGTTTLCAALEVATGKIIDRCMPRHRHQELLPLLRQVAKAYPAAHAAYRAGELRNPQAPNVKAWLSRNKRIELHSPTSRSWLNMVEIFSGIITCQAIRRGTFTSVTDLVDAIRVFIDLWNDRCELFIWTKPADRSSPKPDINNF